jgi:hypothetical protein
VISAFFSEYETEEETVLQAQKYLALESKGRSRQQQPAKILRKNIWFIAVISLK